MAGPELTPEMLAQLDLAVKESVRCEYATEVAIREMKQVVEPWLYDHLARLFAAAPSLVAAAKERDQLQRQVDGSSLGAMRREVQQLRAQLDNTTGLYVSHRHHAATVATALGIDGWENGWPDVAPRIEHMRAERDKLRAEVERLRDLALDAVDVIEEATTPTNKLAAALRAEIERKS